MIKILITAVFSLMSIVANAQTGFLIKGKITGNYEGKKVMLNYFSGDQRIKDSTTVHNGSFLLKGEVTDPTKAQLSIKEMSETDKLEFFLENTTYNVEGSNLNTAKMKGGAAQADYQLLLSQLKPLQDKIRPLVQKMQQYLKEKNETARNELFPQVRAANLAISKAETEFMRNHPDSYVTLDLLDSRSSTISAQIGSFYQLLSSRMKATHRGNILGKRIKTAMNTDVGKPAINFVQNDTEGNPVSLASFRGKYVLIDFWASWCGPCRLENPNLKKAYQKFKGKNFEVIAISLDDKKEPWLKAIKDDGLPWIHVSELNGWKNTATSLYDIKSVPQNVLIGPDGIILAKNLRGEQLEERLGELIKN